MRLVGGEPERCNRVASGGRRGDKVGKRVAAHEIEISKIGRVRVDRDVGQSVRTVTAHRWTQKTTPERGRRVSWTEICLGVRIRRVSARGPR